MWGVSGDVKDYQSAFRGLDRLRYTHAVKNLTVIDFVASLLKLRRFRAGSGRSVRRGRLRDDDLENLMSSSCHALNSGPRASSQHLLCLRRLPTYLPMKFHVRSFLPILQPPGRRTIALAGVRERSGSHGWIGVQE